METLYKKDVLLGNIERAESKLVEEQNNLPKEVEGDYIVYMHLLENAVLALQDLKSFINTLAK